MSSDDKLILTLKISVTNNLRFLNFTYIFYILLKVVLLGQNSFE